MQVRKSILNLSSDFVTQNSEKANFSEVMVTTNRQQNNVLLIGFVASISSLGAIASWQKPLQASVLNSNQQNSVIELSSLSNSITKIDSQATLESDLNHNSSKLFSQVFVSGQTPLIPQLPPLQLAQNQPKKVAKKVHTVKSGETVAGIARQYGISSSQIIEANQLTNPHFIKIDRQLIIPNLELAQEKDYNAIEPNPVSPFSSLVKTKVESQENKVVPSVTVNTPPSNGESIFSNSSSTQDPHISRLRQDIIKLRDKYQTQNSPSQTITAPASQEKTTIVSPVNSSSTAEISESSSTLFPNSSADKPTLPNNIDSLISLGATNRLIPNLPPLAEPEEYLPDSPISNGYIWPAKGKFTSGYGWRWGRMHKGIDIAAPIGTPIVAAASGEVVFSGWNSGGYGNLVKIKHSDGTITFYAHNHRVLVRRGQKVRQGELIAEMGSTGRSTGPHLHFEIRPNGVSAINPIALLPQR